MHQSPAFPTAFDTMSEALKQLRTLQEVLSEEIRAGTVDNKLTQEGQLYKELQLGVQVMLPKLQRALARLLPSDRLSRC